LIFLISPAPQGPLRCSLTKFSYPFREYRLFRVATRPAVDSPMFFFSDNFYFSQVPSHDPSLSVELWGKALHRGFVRICGCLRAVVEVMRRPPVLFCFFFSPGPSPPIFPFLPLALIIPFLGERCTRRQIGEARTAVPQLSPLFSSFPTSFPRPRSRAA